MWTLILIFYAVSWNTCSAQSEEDGRRYLKCLNELYAKWDNIVANAQWNYESNITNETLARQLQVSNEFANFSKTQWEKTNTFPWQNYTDVDIKRQFKKYAILGTPALPADEYEKLEEIISDMESNYATATICDFYKPEKCNLSLEPDITDIMKNSRNEEELKHVWVEWRNKAGKPVRSLYTEYVSLSNKAARLNNFADAGAYWLDSYDTPDFREQIANLWIEIQPFYLQIHAYVRRKLNEFYGDEIVSITEPIPAHLLGNMWAQTWENIADLGLPYPGLKLDNLTQRFIEQNYTALKMFQTAEDFYKSIDLSPMTATFWNKSIIEKPADRDLICHASAWDFFNGCDFRIKMCTSINNEDFTTIHHEMGHIEYYMQYKDQPNVYRDGANPGFHEAIGDVMALSVNTPKHRMRIGLMPNDTNNSVNSTQTDLNYLFQSAMERPVFFPFGYLMDIWRWKVFNGSITEDNYNCEWWKLRTSIQGIKPPVTRSESDFDPGAKFHIDADVPYISYFVSYVLQFQFHEALCKKAGQYDPQNPDAKPLHQCDIYGSKEAGDLLKRVLELGSSKPWPDALELITGQRNMSASSLLRYYKPIYDWIEEENKKNGEYIGWKTNDAQSNRIGFLSIIIIIFFEFCLFFAWY